MEIDEAAPPILAATRGAPIAEWNQRFEANRHTHRSDSNAGAPSSNLLPIEAWDEWLWRSDLHERLGPNLVLHKGHLLGILIARYRSISYPEAMRLRLGALFPTIVHGFVMVEDMSLRQMRDSLEDLQMHWTRYTTAHADSWDAAAQAVDALMARLGFFLNLPPPSNNDHNNNGARATTLLMADDPASLDPERPGCLSVPAIRRFTSLLCVLYRHITLASLAVDEHEDPSLAPAPHPGVENHHLQAGMEDFYRFSMMADLPPGARLLYKQDFQGMYHCVTQVVFMHYPSYERRRQLTLDEMRSDTAPPLNTLCIMAQLSPEARIRYEDEAIVDPEDDETGAAKWNWVLLSGGDVYLVNTARTKVYTSRSLWALMQKCVNESPS